MLFSSESNCLKGDENSTYLEISYRITSTIFSNMQGYTGFTNSSGSISIYDSKETVFWKQYHQLIDDCVRPFINIIINNNIELFHSEHI